MRLRDGKKVGTLLLAALLLTGCGGVDIGCCNECQRRYCGRNMGACEHDL